MKRVIAWSSFLFLGTVWGVEPGVTFSDGSVILGEVRMVPGAELRFHDGTNFRTLEPKQIQEIRLQPTSERLVRAFAMPEPGKAIRVESGDPYPLRELAVIIGLSTGESLRGHLYATAVLVALEDEDRKVFLPAKQQGNPGTTLASLLYPQRVVFAHDAHDEIGARDPTRVRIVGPSAIAAVGMVTRDTLAPLDVVREGDLWRSEPLLGSSPYVAIQTVDAVRVGWDGDEPDLHQRLTKGLAEIRDYYDEKQLIAVRAIPGTSQVDSLMRLVRRGPGTDGPRKPWHVEVWRWVVDDGDPSQLLFSARGTLLRGLYGADAELPQVLVDGHLWPQHHDGNILNIGGTP